MYIQNSTLHKPSNTRQQLWRYMPLNRLLDVLHTGELYFTHLPAFSDGLEGALTNRTREHLANWFKHHNTSDWQRAYREVDEYQKNQNDFYANCWHMNDVESYLMWRAYAGESYAYALRTSFERVQASFDPFNGAVCGGVVNYVNFERDLTPVGNVFNHVATKDLPYRDEKEFRLVVWVRDPQNEGLHRVGNGIRVRVDIRMLIDSVVVSPFEPRIPSELEELLEKLKIPIESSIVKHRIT